MEKIKLTPKEIEVVELLSLGYTDVELCKRLDVKFDAMRIRIRGLTRKSGMKGRGRLVLWSREWMDEQSNKV